MRRREKAWTLRGFIMAIIVFLMVIFECAFLIGSAFISRTLKEQRQASYTSVMELYSGDLDEELKLIDAFMLSSVMIEGNVRDILESTTELDRYLAEIRMKRSFTEETRNMEHLSGAVWYAPDLDTRVKMIKKPEDAIEKNFQKTLDTVIEKVDKEHIQDWFFQNINGKNYLIRVLENRNTYMVGWIDTAVIFQNMKEVLEEDYRNLYLRIEKEMCQETGAVKEEILSPGEEKTPFQIIRPRKNYRVMLCLAIPENKLYNYFANPYVMIPAGLLATGIILTIISFILTKNFIRPMDSLRETMIKMQEGDFDVRMDNSTSFYEFTLLNNNFDRMAEKIKQLKISVYEKQLEKQAVELQYLQHQINPHFLTNCMNTIRNLFVMGDIPKAERFTTLLSKNIRYDLSAKVKISLKEEIDHVKNYIALQQIRYEEQLCLALMVDESLLCCEIPNMVIQTFVENAVKHQVCPDELLHIYVCVREEGEDIYIKIEDDGDGFSGDILRRLRNGETVVKNGVEHIGIENVVKRLKIMYQEKASITFSNSKRGALVEIIIPREECHEKEKYHGK